MTVVPSMGDIVYLAACAIRVGVSAVTTYPDTPNQYTASFKIMGDQGTNLDAVMGPKGPDGQALFGLREIDDLNVNSVDDLPTLTNTTEDIGKYYLIDELDGQGHVLTTWCYIWWGSYYRQIMMGVPGPPGPAPQIKIVPQAIDPSLPPQVLTSGGTFAPTWEFLFPSPAGPEGPIGPLYNFPDVDEVTTPPSFDNVLAFDGTNWGAFNVEQYLPQLFSMPSENFNSYTGVSQQAPVGSFTLPAQPFAWTPLVWGHLSAGGVSLSTAPLMVGAQVLLDNQTSGKQVARGIGNTLGVVNIAPHYSTAQNTHANISPKNGVAIVPAGESATLYINLWNDGQLGFYNFSPMISQTAFQSLLDELAGALGNPVATIEGTIGTLENFVGSIPTDIQTAIDSIVNMLSGFGQGIVNDISGIPIVGPIIGAGIQDAVQALSNFGGLVENLASSLGVGNLLADVANALSSFVGTVTTDIQNAVDSIAQQFGFTGLSQPFSLVSSALNTLQPAIQNLSDLLGGNWIPDIVSLIGSFTGTFTGDIQLALNAVTGALGQGTGFNLGGGAGVLNEFQGLLDNLAGELGIGGFGNTIDAVLTALAPWVTGVISLPLNLAIGAVTTFLGLPIIGPLIESLLGGLLSLLGPLASFFTTDAQLFVMAQPMLEAP